MSKSVSDPSRSATPSHELPPSIRQARYLLDRNDYMSLAALLHHMPWSCLDHLLLVIPAETFANACPASLPVLEVLFSRFLVSERSVESLCAVVFLRRAAAFMAGTTKQTNTTAVTTVGATATTSSVPPWSNSHYRQISNVLRVIQLRCPRLLHNFASYADSLQLCRQTLARNSQPMQLDRRVKGSEVKGHRVTSPQSLEQNVAACFATMVKQIKDVLAVYNGIRTIPSSSSASSSPSSPFHSSTSSKITLSALEERSNRQKNLLKVFQPMRTFKDFTKSLAKLAACVIGDEAIINHVSLELL